MPLAAPPTAARSVLDSDEHGAKLNRIGAPLQTVKKIKMSVDKGWKVLTRPTSLRFVGRPLPAKSGARWGKRRVLIQSKAILL
jgi:hypothetical protein